MGGLRRLKLPTAAQMRLGSNLGAYNYYSIETPFIDVFKCGAGWTGMGNGTTSLVDIDSNGWPLSMNRTAGGGTYTSLRTSIHAGTNTVPAYKSGDYVVLKTGIGTVSYGNDAVIQSSSSTRDVIRCATPTDGFYIDVTAITSGPMTFKVCHVDDEAALLAGTLAHPSFASKIAPFNPLRFMDWGTTNEIATQEWSERTPYTYAFWGYTESGATPVVAQRSVPVEAMVALCNELGKDMYICMPFLASDDYITQCATYVYDNLSPSLKCYVEFANEVWNVPWGFGTDDRWHFYTAFLALAYAEYPSSTSDFGAAFDYGCLRAVATADIWKSVWSGRSSKLVRVIASQASFDDRVRYQLEFTDSRYFTGQAATHFDALATAPYFGASSGDNSALTLTQFFQEINSGGTGAVGAYTGGWIKEAVDWAIANKARADAHGLSLICYEFGQHFVDYSGANATLQTLYQDANEDSRMGAAYTSYLQQLQAAGISTACHFLDIGVPSRFGYWGALPSPLATSSPKHDALVGFA